MNLRRTIMIKTVIKSPNDVVMVFDERGEQVPEYQGQYHKVKETILKDAPSNAIFGYFPNYETELRVVPRDKW
jgi:hypothetical protein